MAAEFAGQAVGVVQNVLNVLSNSIQAIAGQQFSYLIYGGLALVAAWKIKDYSEYMQMGLALIGVFLIAVALGWLK